MAANHGGFMIGARLAHRIIFAELGLAQPFEDDSLALIGKSLDIVLAHLAGPEERPPAPCYPRGGRRLISNPVFVCSNPAAP